MITKIFRNCVILKKISKGRNMKHKWNILPTRQRQLTKYSPFSKVLKRISNWLYEKKVLYVRMKSKFYIKQNVPDHYLHTLSSEWLVACQNIIIS